LNTALDPQKETIVKFLKSSNMKVRLVTFLMALTLFATGVGSAYALSGVYIYANDGSYFTAYGTASYWHTTSSRGYCGSPAFSSCSPYNMRWTYSNGSMQDNTAKWDNIDGVQDSDVYVYVPSVNATTTRAPYTISYNGASSYNFSINQNIYYNQFVYATRKYYVSNIWLGDNTGESAGSTLVGFDEIELIY
jgi:hypothetical protein